MKVSAKPVVASVCLLAISQVLIFPPGSDVSPYAYALGGQTPTTYGGATAQVWSILILVAICGLGLVRVNPRGVTSGFGWTIVAILVVTLGGARSSATVANFAEGVGKLLLPLLLFSYLSAITKTGSHRTLAMLALTVNVFTVGQSIFCKAVTGSFAANTYYRELPEEYFGYFYHPFAFAGIISACSVVAVNELMHRRRPTLMLLLLSVNCFFILQSQVRTYILAIGVALLFALIGSTVGRKSAVTTGFISVLLSLAAIIISRDLVAGARVTTDASSGRLERWFTDIQYVWDTASLADLLLGGGPGRIFEINRALFGVDINSLNSAIDTFVDFGILGLVAAAAAWTSLIRDQYRQTRNPIILSAVALLVTSASVTSPLEFPAVSSMMVIVMLALDPQSARASRVKDCAQPSRALDSQRLGDR